MLGRWNRQGILFLFLAFSGLSGCASLQHTPPAVGNLPPLPSKKQIRVGPYVFISDVNLNKPEHASLVKELEALPDQIYKELHLPALNNVIYVYLFSDRAAYEKYMTAHFKDLPTRRAFFMARSDERRGDELMVYTYWGDRIREDLRHELTHALLHGVLKDVPMWLDEGLAEYYEVPSESQGINYRHLRALQNPSETPWSPNLARLEKLTLVQEMTPADYRESWAWVHFMLRGSPQGKAVLLAYLQELRHTREPGPIDVRLATALPGPDQALRQHVAGLKQATRTLAGTP